MLEIRTSPAFYTSMRLIQAQVHCSKPCLESRRLPSIAMHRLAGSRCRVFTPGSTDCRRSVNRHASRSEAISQGVETASSPGSTMDNRSLRLAIPSKGRMAEDTLQLLKDCQLSVYKPNPRQYVATINQLPDLEVWFQRASDVVRKIKSGDVELGIVGYDMFSEYGGNDPDLVVIHDALNFGHCHLSLGVPKTKSFEDITTFDDLQNMQVAGQNQWTSATPLRVVTGYPNIARKFFEDKGFEHYALLSADGALEAAPAMGSADIILDLVSTGVTLRENNLREIEGGKVLHSEGILVGNRKALISNAELLQIAKELIERFDAHLKAEGYYSVIANLRGPSSEAVAERLLATDTLAGLDGPTISPVYSKSLENGGQTDATGLYATVICVAKNELYETIKQLRKVGGGGILVQPMTYIFDEEPERWTALLKALGLEDSSLE